MYDRMHVDQVNINIFFKVQLNCNAMPLTVGDIDVYM